MNIEEPRVYNMVAALMGLSLVALLLRLVHLNSPIWGDEVLSWVFATRESVWETIWFTRQDPSPPLYYVLLHLTIPFLGDSPAGLRLPSVVCGVLVVPLSYDVVRRAGFSHADGLWAAALIAFSSVLVYYAQEARNYAFMILLAVLSTAALLRCMQQPERRAVALYIGLMVLINWTHRYGLFLVAAQVTCLVLYRQWKLLVLPLMALLGMSTLLAYQIATDAFLPGGSGRAIDWSAIRSLATTMTSGTIGMQDVAVLPAPELLMFPDPVINQILPLLGLGLYGLVLVSGGVGFKFLTATQRQSVVVLSISIIIPTALALLAGSPLSPRPQWLLRGIIYLWPILLILTVALCHRARYRSLLLLGIVALNGLSLYPYYTRYVRFADAPALASLADMATEHDVIIADPWYMHPLVRYYYREHPPMIGFHQQRGWIDVDRLRETNWYARAQPLAYEPQVQGRIFVYPRKGGVEWLHAFPETPVFGYDAASGQWQQLSSD